MSVPRKIVKFESMPAIGKLWVLCDDGSIWNMDYTVTPRQWKAVVLPGVERLGGPPDREAEPTVEGW